MLVPGALTLGPEKFEGRRDAWRKVGDEDRVEKELGLEVKPRVALFRSRLEPMGRGSSYR